MFGRCRWLRSSLCLAGGGSGPRCSGSPPGPGLRLGFCSGPRGTAGRSLGECRFGWIASILKIFGLWWTCLAFRSSRDRLSFKVRRLSCGSFRLINLGLWWRLKCLLLLGYCFAHWPGLFWIRLVLGSGLFVPGIKKFVILKLCCFGLKIWTFPGLSIII